MNSTENVKRGQKTIKSEKVGKGATLRVGKIFSFFI